MSQAPTQPQSQQLSSPASAPTPSAAPNNQPLPNLTVAKPHRGSKSFAIALAAVFIIFAVVAGYMFLSYKAAPLPSVLTKKIPTLAPTGAIVVTHAVLPSASPSGAVSHDTTDTQLDKDAQDVQTSLSKLNTNESDLDQSFTNQSGDTPPIL